MNTEPIDFHGCMHGVQARKLWQRLFDFYREKGCPLGNLDNLLVDYQNCVKVFDSLSGEEMATECFMWVCDPSSYRTQWAPHSHFAVMSPRQQAARQDEEFAVWCEVSYDKATFEILRND